MHAVHRCVLTCAFEPPKPKTKHKLELDSVQAYQDMQAAEKQYFLDMIKKVKDSGTPACRERRRRRLGWRSG